MSDNDLVRFDGVSVPVPLSLRLLRYPSDSLLRVIVDGLPGAVELQIRPALLGSFGGGMSIEVHSRQPMYGAESATPHCEVLDGADCYADGTTLGTGNEFEQWLRARDGQAVVDELVRRHQGTTWTLDDEDSDAPPVVHAQPAATGQLPAGEA